MKVKRNCKASLLSLELKGRVGEREMSWPHPSDVGAAVPEGGGPVTNNNTSWQQKVNN